MPRRIGLPGANEPFHTAEAADGGPDAGAARSARRGTGRVRHDEKITVYISSDELLALETARLTLRGHGMAVDRGRIVREAVAMALEGLDQAGAESDLIHRLRR